MEASRMVTANKLVKFIESKGKPGSRAQAKAAQTFIFIDPGHVSVIYPRADYTTLLVQGVWHHVVGDIDTVIQRLGFTPET